MPSLSNALLFVALALAVLPASAQSDLPGTASSAADSTLAASDSTRTTPDSTALPRFGALLRRIATDASEAQAQELAPPPPAAPAVYAFESGVRVTLPPGWDGPTSSHQGDPSYSIYSFQNTAAGDLEGAAVRLERVAGLNDLLRERWMRGQTPHGYHGTRPVGPSSVPISGFAVEVEGPGTRGVSVFTQRRDGLWALQVVAPLAVWAQRRGELTALLSSITLP